MISQALPLESDGENTVTMQKLLKQKQNLKLQQPLEQEQGNAQNQADACARHSASQQPAQASAAPKQGPSPNTPNNQYPVSIAPKGQTRSDRRVHLLSRYSYSALQLTSDSLSNFAELHPLSTLQSFAAKKKNKIKQRDHDTMTLEEAMQDPDRKKFIEGMKKELDDHTKMHHGILIPQSFPGVPPTWYSSLP